MVKNRKLKLNKYIRVVFKKLRKMLKIIYLLLYFNLGREIYIKINS